jgi:hypothetical protein
MNFLKKFAFLALGLALMGTFAMENKVQAVSYYGLSCTNKAYGTQHRTSDGGSLYIQGYVGLAIDFSASTGTGATAASNHNSTGAGGTYLGQDCLYSGAGLTNSSAIVSGDVARSAANAIVSGVTSRLMVAMQQNGDTAAHMSYTSNPYGIGMAANKVLGGLSLWTNYTDSEFDNDQTFSRNSIDSNHYDGDSSALSFGIDKQFGNIVVGLVGTSFETDLNVDANSGTYSADGETYGLYAGINTGVVMITGGIGTGEYDIDTTRLDLGTGNTTITGAATADVDYYHFSAAATLSRGKFILMPRLAYRNLDLDTPAFTDVVANDSNIAGPSTDNTTGTDSSGKNVDNVSVAAFSASSEMTEVGLNLAIKLGMITPFVDAAFVSEDTTSATYLTELSTDDLTETAASDSDGYSRAGAGITINIKNRLQGLITYYETYDRDDYNESTMSGTLRIRF